jgi:hypothetical protein
MKIRKTRHVLGQRPVQAPPGMVGRWLIAGTRTGEPYPRWISPKRRAAVAEAAREYWANAAPDPDVVVTGLGDGQLDLDWGNEEES